MAHALGLNCSVTFAGRETDAGTRFESFPEGVLDKSLEDVEGNVNTGMPQVIHIIGAILVYDITIVVVVPTYWPSLVVPEPIAAVLEAVISADHLWTSHVERVALAEMGAVIGVRNAAILVAVVAMVVGNRLLLLPSGRLRVLGALRLGLLGTLRLCLALCLLGALRLGLLSTLRLCLALCLLGAAAVGLVGHAAVAPGVAPAGRACGCVWCCACGAFPAPPPFCSSPFLCKYRNGHSEK